MDIENNNNNLEIPSDLAAYHDEIRSASMLLDYAISVGHQVPDDVILEIRKSEQYLDTTSSPSAEIKASFDKSYRDLAKMMTPVTARTLKATDDKLGKTHLLLMAPKQTLSDGRIWSRKLWLMTIVFFLAAFVGENLQYIVNHPYFTVDFDTGKSVLGLSLVTWQVLAAGFKTFVPFTYGAIGSCAFLLRTCHRFVHERSFDTNRIPEYYSRILLGLVSGGVIILFIDPDQTTIKISAVALAFLAGYNSDFLFTTIERVSAAIFPKVPAETETNEAQQSQITEISLDKVIEEYGKATTPEAKKVLEAIIERIKERI